MMNQKSPEQGCATCGHPEVDHKIVSDLCVEVGCRCEGFARLDLDEMQRLADAATPGPWERQETVHADNHVTAGGGVLTGTHVCGPTYERQNALFIAAARDAVPALIRRVHELEDALSASASAHPADEHHDAEERESESEDHAATVTGDREELVAEAREHSEGEPQRCDCGRPGCDGQTYSTWCGNEWPCLTSRLAVALAAPSRPVEGAIRHAVQSVVWNASNHPEPSAVLGRDIRPLTDKIVASVMAALAAPIEVDEAKLAEVIEESAAEWGDSARVQSVLAQYIARSVAEWLRGEGR